MYVPRYLVNGLNSIFYNRHNIEPLKQIDDMNLKNILIDISESLNPATMGYYQQPQFSMSQQIQFPTPNIQNMEVPPQIPNLSQVNYPQIQPISTPKPMSKKVSNNQPQKQESVPVAVPETIPEEPAQPIVEEPKVEETPPAPEKKYKFTAGPNDIIQVPSTYSTDDELEYKVINLINENKGEGNPQGWEKLEDEDGAIVYGHNIERANPSAMMFLTGNLPYSSSKVFKAICDYNWKKTWEKMYEKGELITTYPKEGNMTKAESYLYMKMPMLFDDRDFVVEDKYYENYLDMPDHYFGCGQSIQNAKYPPTDNPVRGEFVVKGFYVKPIDANNCTYYGLVHIDVKVSIGGSTLLSKAASGQIEWYNKFIDKLKEYN